MAVIRYKCTVCDRNIEIIEQPTGLERIGPCVITDRCRGSLYKVDRLEDYAVGQFPADVSGLTNYIKRNVLYNHTQAIAEVEWLVEHDLGVNPSVQVVVNREETVDGVVVNTRPEIEPQLITLIDANTLTIRFDRPESGLAQVQARSSAFTQTVEAVDPGITYLPVSQSNILTVAVDCESGQFPAGSISGTQLVRLYYLDQETLDATAFESAVFKDYEARSPISTSAWNDTSEIFVNGQLYTVLSIDIGDPVNDIGAPSAGAVLFQAGKATTAFPYDQAPNMVVLLSDPPHANVDKNRRQLFRPELNVGPALALDSFIFANGELFIDQTKAEYTFPPIFSVSNTQDCPVPAAPVTPVAGAFVIGATSFTAEATANTLQILSDDDITTWTLSTMAGSNNTGGSPQAWNFVSPNGLVYAEELSMWVGTATSSQARVFNSIDDGTTWTQQTTVSTVNNWGVDWNGTYFVVAGSATGGFTRMAYSTDGVTWNETLLATGSTGRAVHWTGSKWICSDSSNRIYTTTTPESSWGASIGTAPTDFDVFLGIGDEAGAGRIIGGSNGGVRIYYSDDAGVSWNTPSFNNPVHGSGISNITGLASNGTGTVVAVGGVYLIGSPFTGYYYLSTDNGATFTQTVLPDNLRGSDCIYDPDYGFVMTGIRTNLSNTSSMVGTSPTGLGGSWTIQFFEPYDGENINIVAAKSLFRP